MEGFDLPARGGAVATSRPTVGQRFVLPVAHSDRNGHGLFVSNDEVGFGIAAGRQSHTDAGAEQHLATGARPDRIEPLEASLQMLELDG